MPQHWSADTGYYSKANLAHTNRLESDYDTEFFISTRRMKHDELSPKPTKGPASDNATDTQRMAWRRITYRGNKIYTWRIAIVELAFRQITTRQGIHVLLRGMENARSGIC